MRSRRSALVSAVLLVAALAACSSDADEAATDDVTDSTDATRDTTSDTTSDTTTPDTSAPATTAPPTTAPATTTTPTTEPAPPGDPLLVTTGTGSVRGTASDVDGVRAFLAIPFAEAPTGDLAWAPPVPRAPWDGELDGTSGGASCPQTTEGVTTQIVITPDPDPDCLTLSVWSPDDAAGLPVMVWFHGGGLTTGSAHEPYYTGDDLAAEGVVVVNVNYRLGAFGFLALPELAADDGAVGNWGLLDQQLALEWVRDNVGAFGGDPDRVTIFGESAGGFSVCAHLAAPGSEGLFAQAIVQSGGGCDRFLGREDAFEAGAQLLAAVGCPDVACLRTTDDQTVIDALDEVPRIAAFVADGVTLDRPATELATAGELPDIPILIGANADEASLFTIGLEEPTDSGVVELTAELVADPADVDAFVALYPADAFASNLERYRAMVTDVTFACPPFELAATTPSTFVYHFTFVSESNPLGLGATHGSELAYVFNHPEGLALPTNPTERTQTVSDAVQAAWVAFATDGDPGPEFSPYADAGTVAVIDLPVTEVDEIRDGRCDAVNELIG